MASIKKDSNVSFINKKIYDSFKKLEKGNFEDKQLLRFLNQAFSNIKSKPDCGIKIPKKFWPKTYIQNFQINNLWKYDLPNAWRLIYTIKEEKVEIISLILEWFTHKDYEKRFKY